MNDNALIKLDAAQHALAECKTVMEAKQIADVAEAARVYLERTNASAETVNRATEIRLLAERQMGEFLKKMPKATGYEYGGGGTKVDGSRTIPATKTPRLRDIGITNQQSSTAQRLASIPHPEFVERIEAIKANGERLTLASVADPVLSPKPTARCPDRPRHSRAVAFHRYHAPTKPSSLQTLGRCWIESGSPLVKQDPGHRYARREARGFMFS